MHPKKKPSELFLDRLKADGPIYWGAAAIAARLGRTRRQTYHLLAKQRLKGAIKLGATWVMTERTVRLSLCPWRAGEHR